MLAIRAGVEISAERRCKIMMDNALRASSILIGIKHEGGGTRIIAMDKRFFFFTMSLKRRKRLVYSPKKRLKYMRESRSLRFYWEWEGNRRSDVLTLPFPFLCGSSFFVFLLVPTGFPFQQKCQKKRRKENEGTSTLLFWIKGDVNRHRLRHEQKCCTNLAQ